MSIQDIIQAFRQGKTLVSFKTDRPHHMRQNLYEQARRRGYLWRFAILENEVFVVR